MNSDEKKESLEEDVEKAEEIGLSDEAKLSSKQKKQMKELGDNRFLVSTDPIDEKKAEDYEYEEEKVEHNQEIMKEEEMKQKDEKYPKKGFNENLPANKSPISEPRKLVKLLSTYEVPLNAPVRKLVKKIRNKGKGYLRKQIEEIRKEGG